MFLHALNTFFFVYKLSCLFRLPLASRVNHVDDYCAVACKFQKSVNFLIIMDFPLYVKFDIS